MATRHFILIYDADAGALTEAPREFARGDRALTAFEKLEREHLGNERMQIVLLGSSSLESIKVTHANFFQRDSPIDLAARLLAETAKPRPKTAA